MSTSSQKKGDGGTFFGKDFERLNQFIHAHFGIQIPFSKKKLLPGWLKKRISALGIGSIKDYIDRLLDPKTGGDEMEHFIDIVTTHDTGFFREPEHYDYLAREALPELVQKKGAGVNRPLMLWSAGCSSGEEPYTMTMVLREFAEHVPGINFKAQVLATDISQQALDTGTEAIYPMEKADEIPINAKKKYLLKGKDARKNLVRVDPALRSMVRFRQLNLVDEQFSLREAFDVIFCRNVILYFDKPTKERVINKLYNFLNPGGYLFVGHSESLSDIETPLIEVAPAIYQMPG